MIARTDRDMFCSALAGYLAGACDNDDLDDALLRHCYGRHRDAALQRIGDIVWLHYCDIRTHRVSLTRQGWQLFRRCIAFLRTDLTHAASQNHFDEQVWPFRSRRELFSTRPDLSDLQLPRYDPSKHGVPLPPLYSAYHLPTVIVVVVVLVLLVRWLAC
jgi:hypothetical protein